MTESRFPPPPMGNRLLARLPADEYERLLPLTRLVTLEFRHVLYEPQALLDHLYFPNQGVISMVMVMESGAQIEVATVGKEGVVGLSSLFGAETSFARCLVQVPGTALRLRADLLRQGTRRAGPLRQVLYLDQAALLKQVARAGGGYSRSKATTPHVTLSREPRSRAVRTSTSAHSSGLPNCLTPRIRSSSEMKLVRPSLASSSRSPAAGVNGRTSASSVISAQPRNL